jgi:hypothetical protein
VPDIPGVQPAVDDRLCGSPGRFGKAHITFRLGEDFARLTLRNSDVVSTDDANHSSTMGGRRLTVARRDGFRRTHRQAQPARDVALAAGPHAMPVTYSADPGLHAGSLLWDNLDEVREWVREVLGPLSSAVDVRAAVR